MSLSKNEIEKLVKQQLKKRLDELIPSLQKEITENVLTSLKKGECFSESSEKEDVLDFNKMTYKDLIDYAKKNGITYSSKGKISKEKLIEIIKNTREKPVEKENVEKGKHAEKEKPVEKGKQSEKKPRKINVAYNDQYKVYIDDDNYIYHSPDEINYAIIGKLDITKSSPYLPLTKEDEKNLKILNVPLYHSKILKRKDLLSKDEMLTFLKELWSEDEEEVLVVDSDTSPEKKHTSPSLELSPPFEIEEDKSSSADEEKDEPSVSEDDLNEEEKDEPSVSEDDLSEDEKEEDSNIPETDNLDDIAKLFSKVFEDCKNKPKNCPEKESSSSKKTKDDSSSKKTKDEDKRVSISESDFRKYQSYMEKNPKKSIESSDKYANSIGISKKQLSEIILNYAKYEKQFPKKEPSRNKLEKRDDDDE
jgi:hypothetical protein